MQTLSFSININAAPETVWFVLWNDLLYRKWTTVFCEGSYAVSTWQPGSRIHFLSPGGRGMYADIVEMEAPRSMRFKHLGEIVDFEETTPPENWSDTIEAYQLEATAAGTKLHVSVDTLEAYCGPFEDMFPKALEIVKALSEDFQIHISTHVLADIETVWQCFTQPEHVTQWNQASDDWHTPHAEADLRVGGTFTHRMEAKDGSMGFDFIGTFDVVEPFTRLAYHMEDGRKVNVTFTETDTGTQVHESFDPEYENSFELQYAGWGAILESFRQYTEGRHE